jgi:hypothetical protein
LVGCRDERNWKEARRLSNRQGRRGTCKGNEASNEKVIRAVEIRGAKQTMAVPTWLTEMGIIGTWAVGFLALFGDRIRATIFKPKLHLELKSAVGSYITQTPPPSTQTESVENVLIAHQASKHARYYHLRVTNRARYPIAQDVQVLLLGIEWVNSKFGRSGALYVPLVLGWARSIYPLDRKIGSKTDAVADLFFVREDGLTFVPVVIPNNFKQTYVGETHLIPNP